MTSTTEGPTARAAAFLGGIGELLVAEAARQSDGSTDTGADAITTLRCQQASRPEDQIWHTLRNQAPAA